jgi:hypothetical protein
MSLVEKVKHDLLSISAVIVTILHIFMIVGGVTCWIGFQAEVLGKEPIKMSFK